MVTIAYQINVRLISSRLITAHKLLHSKQFAYVLLWILISSSWYFPSFFVAIMITSFLFLQQHVEMRREMTLISTSYRTKAVEQT